MLRKQCWAGVLILVLLSCQSAGAGLYNTAEPMKGPRPTAGEGAEALGFTEFREIITDMSNIGNPLRPSALNKHYEAQRDELLAKNRSGSLTTDEKVNLSAYLIRLREYEKAIELLMPLAAQERRNFMVFANLATAEQMAGRLDRAISYLEMVKDLWPKEWPGLTADQLNWYREAEKYHLRLVRLRHRETLRAAGGRGKGGDTLDDLFGSDKGSVRFVGEAGQFEVGKLAVKERDKLPSTAMAITQQLLLWIPGPAPGMEDPRLFWLLGELYNAEGDAEAAGPIFQTLVSSYRFDAPELREHRKILQAAQPEPVAARSTASSEKIEGPTWIPNWHKVAIVGGIAGVVIAALIYLQVREMRRRRKSFS